MEARSHSRALLAMVTRLAEQDPADIQAILAEFNAADRAELIRLVEVYQRGERNPPPGQSRHAEPTAAAGPVFSAWLATILAAGESASLDRRTKETTLALRRIAPDHGWRAQAPKSDTSRIGRLMSGLRLRS